MFYRYLPSGYTYSYFYSRISTWCTIVHCCKCQSCKHSSIM